MKCSFLVGVVTFGLCGSVMAAEDTQKAPATQPAAVNLVNLGDKKALSVNVGKDVVVEGTVSDAQWSATGRVFIIKFKEGEATGFEGAIFASNRSEMEKAFDGDLSNALEGARIQIAGKLENYRQHPEIPIHDPKQITIVVKGPGHSPHAAATRPAPGVHLFGIYAGITTLSEAQRAQIAAIQKESRDAELAAEKKIADDETAKIDALLTDEQKQQVKSLQEKARPRGNGGGGAD